MPASFTDDVDLMIEETKAAAATASRCIVDGGHPDMDRDLDALKRIATESGVHIVASGGYYMQRNYPADIATKTADQIADDLVRDATAQRLGAFGEIGQQGGVLTDDERKVFTAVAKAQARTGIPIFTHNAYTGDARGRRRRCRWTPRSSSSTCSSRPARTCVTSRSATCAASTIRRRRFRSSSRSAASSSVSIA